ncbi:MAG: Rpn family recombination-promoting nuclease/putative transposase [Planctomycetaceae bacterium]|nr:Rpn family recombination-promoting nuclease/putative transposase [Planctomycetaceae bacterium]
MSKYLDPYTDFGFKKIFGEEANKDLLIDFLNSFLPEKHQIETLAFRNTEQLGPIPFDRKAFFDIYCEAKNGEKFIVEMQKAKQNYFKDRAIFYVTFPIRDQSEKGTEWQFELKAVYYVGVLDFEYDENEERRKFLRDVTLKDQDGDLFYDKLHFIFLQMPLFMKTESELVTRQDKWNFFLKNLVSLDHIPAILHEPVFQRAFETAEIARMSNREYLQYEANLKIHRDEYAVMETAKLQAHAEGRAEGKIAIALEMKKDGVDPRVIAKYTGLSPEEIDRLDRATRHQISDQATQWIVRSHSNCRNHLR